MDRLLYVMDAYPAVRIVLIFCAISLVCSLIGRLFKLAALIAVASIIISVASTVCFGDGAKYVETASQFLSEAYRETAVDVRKYEDDAHDIPVLELEDLPESFADKLQRAKDIADSF